VLALVAGGFTTFGVVIKIGYDVIATRRAHKATGHPAPEEAVAAEGIVVSDHRPIRLDLLFTIKGQEGR
jgi:hypothetical protein